MPADSSSQRPVSKRGVYLQLSVEMVQKIATIRQNCEAACRAMGLPQNDWSDQDILIDLIRRGYSDYQNDKSKVH